MSEKMRDGFSEWFYGEVGLKCKFDSYGNAYVTESSRTTGDTIVNTSCCIAWQAWQASRAALVVELPDSTGCGPAYHEAICDVTCSLDDAGVGYKWPHHKQ